MAVRMKIDHILLMMEMMMAIDRCFDRGDYDDDRLYIGF